MKLPLRKHQEEALEFALNAKHSICSVEMGGGKTAIGLALAEHVKGKTLIVVPAFLKRNWKNEIDKFLEDSKDITITSYSGLSKVELQDFVTIIADESQYIKNFEAKRTKLFHSIVNQVKPKYLLLLTGTPIKNRVPEIWSQLQVCHYNGNYPSFKPFFKLYYKFCNRFCYERTFEVNRVPIIRFEGVRRVPELKELIKPIYFRRKTSDFLDLPDSVETVVRGKKATKQMEKEMKEALLSFDQDPSDPAYMSLKRANAVAKVDITTKLVKDMLEQGKRVVVFTDHVDSCNELAHNLKATPITGKMNPEARAIQVENFEAKKTKVIVATTGSLSVGFNLVSSNYMVFNDLPFVPADLDQAKARIRRMGQLKKCFYYYICNSETDEKLIEMLKRKNAAISKVI